MTVSLAPVRFISTQLYAPITALCFLTDTYLIIGKAFTLTLVNILTNEIILEINDLWSSSSHHHVYGIQLVQMLSTTQWQLIAFGSKELVVFHLEFMSNNEKWTFKKIKSYTAHGWILATHILPIEKLIAIVTAQHEVILFSPRTNGITTFGIEEYCLLYSASIHGNCKKQLLIASGAPSNQIILRNLNMDTNLAELVMELIGHEGAIFGLTFNSSGTQLVSTSDDRSVRVWCLLTRTCLHKYYGHTSRVWKASFIGPYIVSVSEDANCRFWKQGQCVFDGEGHRGKNIWSLAKSMTESILATGGNDGVVRFWHLEEIEKSIHEVSFPVCTIFPKKAHIRNMILSDNAVTCISSEGQIASFELSSSQWTSLGQFPELGHYSVMNSTSSMVMIGSKHGSLYQFHRSSSCDSSFSSCSVSSFLVQPHCLDPEILNVFPLLADPFLYLVQHRDQLCLYEDHVLKATWSVSIKEPLLDALIWKDFIFTTTRLSELWIFSQSQLETPVSSISSMHQGEAVTSLCLLHSNTLLTGGRDGYLAFWDLTLTDQDEVSITFNYRERITKGWIEKVIHSISNRYYIVAFYQKQVYLYDFTTRSLMYTFYCGGPHRIWHSFLSSQHEWTFACLRKSQLHVHTSPLHLPLYTHASFFGRELRACAWFSPSLLLLGGEDGILTLYDFNQHRIVAQLHQDGLIKAVSVCSDIFVTAGQDVVRRYRYSVNDEQLVKLQFLNELPLHQQARVMCLDHGIHPTLSKVDQKKIVWGVGLSNGNVLLIQFPELTGKDEPKILFELCIGRCVLCLKFLELNQVLYVFIGTTAGDLHLYRVDSMYRMHREGQLSLHSGGLNCIDIIKDQKQCWIVTGGDDNGLTVCQFKNQLHLRWIYDYSCGASITQVRWFNFNGFFSLSLDRQLRYFVYLKGSLKIFEQVNATFVSISDTASMSLLGNTLAMVGVGLQLFKIKQTSGPLNSRALPSPPPFFSD